MGKPKEPTEEELRQEIFSLKIETGEDFRCRIHMTGSARNVKEVAKELIPSIMREIEQARYRKRFFSAAHLIVFSVAGLSVLGMVAHFLNLRQFNTLFLVGMGAWTVGSIIYLYLVIIRDVFGVKANIREPPRG